MISGKLQKLRIESYKDNNYKNPDFLGEYEVLFNPEQLEESVKVNYSGKGAKGTSTTSQKYGGTDPLQFKLNLYFDGTGLSEASDDVATQIKKFKEVVLDTNPESHKPRSVKIIWGDFLYKVVLRSLRITYSLFQPDGAPLRAKAEAGFDSSIDDKERARKEDLRSPDLTHILIVKAGDTLPLLTKDIYGKESYYMEVARFNNLKNFRQLTPGSKLYFPPLDKAS